MLESVRADLNRYCGVKPSLAGKLRVVRTSCGFRATAIHRFGRWVESAFASPGWLPVRCLLLGVYACLSHAVGKAFGIWIDRRAHIGKGLYIGHFGGIVIGVCRMGEHCSVHQHVRVGMKKSAEVDAGPQIGDKVWIGAHARIVGSVRIGNGVTVSAGCVVRQDIRSGRLVAGDPARVINPNYDNTQLLAVQDGKRADPTDAPGS